MGAKMCKRRKRPQPTKLPAEPAKKTLAELKAEEVIIAEYQKNLSFEERAADSLDCRSRHPECVPLIIERCSDFKEVKQLECSNFLFHCKSQTAQAMVRTQKEVQGKKMWFYVHMPDNKLKIIYPQSLLGVLYQRYKRTDGNLYIFYSDKNILHTSSVFMTIVQILCGILIAVYLYVYFFGINDIIHLFGYNISDFIHNSEPPINQVNPPPEVPTQQSIEL